MMASTDTRPELRVLALSDGRPGHFNQTKGVLRALEFHYNVRIQWCELRLRTGIARPILRAWLKATRSRFPIWPVRCAYRSDHWPASAPDLIVSAGGNTLPVNAWMARYLNARNLFVGSIRRFDPRGFWRVLSYEERKPTPPFLSWNITPVPLDTDELRVRGHQYRQQHRLTDVELWALLVGGNGGGYRYERADWERLANVLKWCANQYNIRWLVVTSRRTGSEAELMLREKIGPYTASAVSFFSDDQGRFYKDFLGAADRVFTTEDSHMMLTEAVYSGKPVVSLRPRNARPDESNRMFLDAYVRHGWISRQALDEPFILPVAKPTRFESPLRDLGRLLCEQLEQEFIR